MKQQIITPCGFYHERLSHVSDQLNSYISGEEALPMFALPLRRDDLEWIEPQAVQIRQKARQVIVLGTGGSSLGGQTLCVLGDGKMPVIFLDNPDPVTMQNYLNPAYLRETHLLIISKSGETMETVSQAMLFLEALQQAGGNPSQQAHIITVPAHNSLRAIAAHYDVPVLDHDPHVGGRYSVLSLVGLLPAAIAGVDIRAVRQGAATVLAEIKQLGANAPAIAGGLWMAGMMRDYPISVLMPYADKLRLYSLWYQQLWAESLAKNNKGSTLVAALGSVDQHSQLQLYLDGPRDKHFTLIEVAHQGTGAALPDLAIPGLAHMSRHSMGDVMAALQYGTIETLRRHRLPLRLWQIEVVTPQMLGALLMHGMVETIVAAQTIGVNAFDQPAVEESKQLARAHLADTPYAA